MTCPVCHREVLFHPIFRDGVTKLEARCLHCDKIRIITEEEHVEWSTNGL